MSSNTSRIPNYQKRLRAREQMLEMKAQNSLQELKNKEAYFQSNGKEMVTDEIVMGLYSTNPVLGKVAAKVLNQPSKNLNSQNPQGRRLQNRSSSLLNADNVMSRFAKMGTIAIPLLLTIGERKLLSYSLKGAGKLIRFTLGNLFGIRKRRKK